MAEVDAGEARQQAQRVLEGDRYRTRDVPRPFRGALRWVGERVQDVVDPVADALSTPVGLAAALVLVAAVTVALVVWAVRRRTRVAAHHEDRRRRAGRPDPDALDAEAEAAEAAGDLEAAVRLRFRAGVLRLEAAGVLARRPDATTGRLRRDVPSPAFGALAATFDEVAYGGRRPTPDDVARARRGWPVVLAEAGAGASAVTGGAARGAGGEGG